MPGNQHSVHRLRNEHRKSCSIQYLAVHSATRFLAWFSGAISPCPQNGIHMQLQSFKLIVSGVPQADMWIEIEQ
jgi:hypothetical protein